MTPSLLIDRLFTTRKMSPLRENLSKALLVKRHLLNMVNFAGFVMMVRPTKLLEDGEKETTTTRHSLFNSIQVAFWLDSTHYLTTWLVPVSPVSPCHVVCVSAIWCMLSCRVWLLDDDDCWERAKLMCRPDRNKKVEVFPSLKQLLSLMWRWRLGLTHVFDYQDCECIALPCCLAESVNQSVMLKKTSASWLIMRKQWSWSWSPGKVMRGEKVIGWNAKLLNRDCLASKDLQLPSFLVVSFLLREDEVRIVVASLFRSSCQDGDHSLCIRKLDRC